ncbi:MAG: flavin-nucleotide-binding protein [Burkholderiales bacterium]
MAEFLSSRDEHFHAGECAVQAHVLGGADARARMTAVGRLALRDHMPDQHRAFFAQLPFLLVGSVDAAGQPWASALAAPPGFVTSPGPQHLAVNVLPHPADPLHQQLAVGAPLGLLGLQPHTRRRNRANGVVSQLGPAGFGVRIHMSFGNCPKYIAAREPYYAPPNNAFGDALAHTAPPAAQVTWRSGLDDADRSLLTQADTFFIATTHPDAAAPSSSATQGVDISHRGGKSGFVRVDENALGQASLTVPDFTGNFFFNTLGNLNLHPFAGLLFIDFANGDLLYLAVKVDIVWEGAEVRAFSGAQRLLRMTVLRSRRVPAALPLRWGPATMSPVLADTGTWLPPQSALVNS